MKKLTILFILMFTIASCIKTYAMSYSDAIKNSSKTPAAICIYADWADDVESYKARFSALEKEFAGKYNFVLLNISSNSMREFNEKYPIQAKLPYVVLFKNGGMVSRQINRECFSSQKCAASVMRGF